MRLGSGLIFRDILDQKHTLPFEPSGALVHKPHNNKATWPPGGRGGTLIFSNIRRLRSFFLVQNFEFQYFIGFSEKKNIFSVMKILWTFFGGHHKIGLYLGLISMHFRGFFRSRYKMGIYFGLLKFHIFLGCLKFRIFFGSER